MRVFGSIVLLVLAAPALAQEGDVEAVKSFLGSLQLGDTLQHGDVTVVPIRATGEPADPGVVADLANGPLTFREPDNSAHKHYVLAKNGGEKTCYLPGGTVLVGGHMDRLVRRDYLIAPGAEVSVKTLPAASSSDFRKEATPFAVSPVFAPLYVRAQADFGGSNSLVPSFVARWSDFLNEGDDRKSLAAFIDSTKLREYALGTKAELNSLPKALAGPQTIGGVSALHGRIQSIATYANNDLLAACFPPMVKGATYAAAALAIRSEQVKLPLPGIGDPDKRKELVHAEAKKFLEKLKTARLKQEKLGEGEAGSSIEIRLIDGTQGRATVINGAVVHMILYPKDPFRQKLYGSAIRVPDEKVEPEADEKTDPGGEASDEGGDDDDDDISDDEHRWLKAAGIRKATGGGRPSGGGRRR